MRKSVPDEWRDHVTTLSIIQMQLSRRPTHNVDEHIDHLQSVIDDLQKDIIEYEAEEAEAQND